MYLKILCITTSTCFLIIIFIYYQNVHDPLHSCRGLERSGSKALASKLKWYFFKSFDFFPLPVSHNTAMTFPETLTHFFVRLNNVYWTIFPGNYWWHHQSVLQNYIEFNVFAKIKIKHFHNYIKLNTKYVHIHVCQHVLYMYVSTCICGYSFCNCYHSKGF